MKAINKFLDKASLWKVFLFGIIIFGGFTYWLFTALFSSEINKIHPLTDVKLSLFMSIVLGGMFTLMIRMARESTKFWEAAELFENNIMAAQTKSDTQRLIDTGFDEMKKFASGTYHYQEVKRLASMLKIKHSMLK